MEKTLNRETGRADARMLALTGLFAALGCVGTMVLRVPSPTGGYMNLGDAVVVLGAWLLGPVYGAIAGGVGPAMADLLGGYAVYVPATLVIKAVMALTAAGLYRRLGKKGLLLSAAAAEAPMVLGYWLFDGALAALSGGGSLRLCLLASAAGVPSNLVQAVFGAAAATLLALALRRSGYARKQFPSLCGSKKTGPRGGSPGDHFSFQPRPSGAFHPPQGSGRGGSAPWPTPEVRLAVSK